jgi:hypothetical protein
LWFQPVPLLKFWDSTSIRPRPVPFKSYPIHYSVITLLHGPRHWQCHGINYGKILLQCRTSSKIKPWTQPSNLNMLSSCKTYNSP